MAELPTHRAAQKMREYRRKRALSQTDFGMLFGISRAHVARLERGDMNPGAALMLELRNAGVCEPNDWFDPPASRHGDPAGDERRVA